VLLRSEPIGASFQPQFGPNPKRIPLSGHDVQGCASEQLCVGLSMHTHTQSHASFTLASHPRPFPLYIVYTPRTMAHVSLAKVPVPEGMLELPVASGARGSKRRQALLEAEAAAAALAHPEPPREEEEEEEEAEPPPKRRHSSVPADDSRAMPSAPSSPVAAAALSSHPVAHVSWKDDPHMCSPSCRGGKDRHVTPSGPHFDSADFAQWQRQPLPAGATAAEREVLLRLKDPMQQGRLWGIWQLDRENWVEASRSSNYGSLLISSHGRAARLRYGSKRHPAARFQWIHNPLDKGQDPPRLGKDADGYVRRTGDSTSFGCHLHSQVLHFFYRPREEYRGMKQHPERKGNGQWREECDHRNNVKDDNCLFNLWWVTCGENDRFGTLEERRVDHTKDEGVPGSAGSVLPRLRWA
jgi:hypothetical protein